MRELEWLTQYFQEREWQGQSGTTEEKYSESHGGVGVGGSGAQTLQSKGHAGWEPGSKERAS